MQQREGEGTTQESENADHEGRESPFDPLGQLYIGWEGGGNLAPAPWWVQYLQIGPWAAT